MNKNLCEQELHGLTAYWRAANYLSVGQIYFLDNPLLMGVINRVSQLGARGTLETTHAR